MFWCVKLLHVTKLILMNYGQANFISVKVVWQYKVISSKKEVFNGNSKSVIYYRNWVESGGKKY